MQVSTVLYPSLEPVTVAGVRQQDPLYINGAIRLWIRGQYLLGDGEWDLVDQLWGYLVDGLAQLDAGSQWSTYLPDQPILVEIHRHGDLCEVRVEFNQVRRAASCSFASLRNALLAEAERIFGVLEAAETINSGMYARYRAKALSLLRNSTR